MSLNARINPVLRHSLRELLRRPPLAVAMLGVPGLALAGPTGEDVIRGSADITRPDAQRTNITQHTDRAVINWQTFNVDADEFVTFFQPGASSIVLNRVLGGDASYILGHIEANGQVFLLNPHGVFFTHGASLDVQGFLGSTLDMDPDAFMAGDFSLTRNGASPSTAQVINDGTLSAGPGGYIVLAGDFTENTGVITANAGTVALVSGNALTLDIEGDGLVNFAVNEATLSEAAGVHNAGSLIADGGRVIMTAKVANDLVATAVNNEGLVRAHAIEERNGEIYLVGNGGDVVNSGMLDADGENADGGRMLVRSDRDVILADGGVQTAAGDANHEGGMLRFIAEEHLDYQQDNTIRATGGVSGGFVEVSGHGSIALRGIPSIGPGGTFYIDPPSITIYDGSNTTPAGSVGSINDGYIEAQLNVGVDVILAASSTVMANSNTSINATGSGDLTVGIGQLSGGTPAICEGTNNSFCFGPGVTFVQSGVGNIDLANLALNIGGNLLIDAGNGGTVSTGDLVTTDGNIRIFGGNVTTGLIDASAGVNNAGDVGLGNSARGMTNLNAGSIHADGSFQAWTFGSVGNGMNIVGNVVTGGAALLWAGGNGSTINPNVTVTGSINAGASVDITANGGSFGGNIKVGSITANNNVTLTANGQATNTGRIEIGTGASPEANYDGGDVISTTGNISITATGPSAQDGGVIVAGGISAAAGDVTLVADGGSSGGGHIHLGDYVSGVFTGANATAGGTLTLTANGDQNAVVDAGNLQGADISVTANPIHTVEFGRGTVTIGNATATGIGGSGHITIDAFAGSTSNAAVTTGVLNAAGDITVNATGDTNTSGAVIGGASLDIAGISGAQHATLSVSGVSGTLQLDNITGVSTQLMVNTTHGADIGNVNITGNFIVNAAGQMIDFVGGATAGDITVTAAAINDVFSSTGINASGNLSLTASDGDITVYDVDAGGSISLTATGNSLGGGNISIGAGEAGLGITMSASGDSAATNAGNITIASGLLAGGNISVTAVSSGNQGANITVSGGGIQTTAGSVTLYGSANNYGGNVSVVGAGTVGILATNGISIDASANGGSPSSAATNATVFITGQVRGGTGAVNIRAGTGAQGGNSSANIHISGTGTSAGVISGASVIIEASAAFGSGTGTNSGQVHLGFGSPEANFTGAQVNATTGNVAVFALGGRGVFTAGDINAAGSASITADGNQGHVHLGDYTSNVLTTPGNITAGTYVTVDVTGNDARIDAGNIIAGNTMNLGAHAQPGGGAAITVGTLANTGTSISGNINLTVGSASAGSPVVGTLDVGGVTAAHTLNINITPGSGGLTLDNLTGINDNLQINTTVGANIGTANFAGGFTYTGGNTNIDFGGTFTAGGNVFVDATTLSAQSGITIGAADLTFNNDVTAMSGANIVATGNVDIRASGSAGSITIGDVSGAAVRIDALGTTPGYGNVTLGDVTGTGLVNLIANGSGSNGGGVLTVNSVTGGSVSLNAYANAGTGGTIMVSGDVISTAGSIDMYASNFTDTGTIKLLGNVDAAGSFFGGIFDAGAGNNTLEIHGNVTAGNNLDFGSGVDHLFFGAGSHTLSAGGNLQIGDVADMVNGGAVNYSASGDIFINATDVLVGNVTAGGIVQINGNGGTTHTIGNVSANHIDMHFGPPSGGAVTVTTGDLAATGTASFNRDIVVQMHGGSTGTTANLTLGDVTTANGEVVLTVFEGVSGSGAGNLTAGAISAERFARIVARGDVTTGAITINNAAGAANLQIQSHTGSSSAAVGGDITINGNLTVTGRGEALSPQGAFVRLDAGAGTSVITVTGDVSVSVAGGAFSFSGTDSSGNPVTMSGLMGAGGVQMNSRFGTVNLGNVYVDTVGEGFIDVQALHVSAGDIALNVADGSFTHETVLTSCSGSPCNITRTETTTGNGRGEVHLGYYGVAIDGTLDFGNVTVNAGDARFNANGFANITGNAITVNATGGDLTQTSTGTFAGNAINYTETGNGGGAEVSLRTTPAGSVTLAGALDVNAQGRGQVNIGAATVSVQDVTVTATGGTFTRTGQPVPQEVDDGPFGEGMDNGGPRIDEGTITGGMAQIHISGVPSSSSMTSGDVLANSVTVNGALSVSAPGAANIHVAANNVTVTGALVAAAGAVVQDGTRFEEYLDSTGDTIKVASTVQSSYGEAHVSVNGSAAGVINVGDITVSGPVAGGHVEGGDVTLGAITITGTGGDLNVEETTTNVTAGTVSNFTFDGPALLTGFGIQGAGDVTVGGDIALSAVGAGGMIISGDTVSLQNVTLNVTDGNYEILDTEIFGATAHAFTLGDVLLDINAATTATVNGNVSITAGHTARVGGEYTATGTISIDAGKHVTSSISTEVQYLHAIDDEGESDPLVLSGPMNIAATGVAITAGGSVDLSSTVITVGTGSAPGATGDSQLLSLLAIEGLAPTSSAPNLVVSGANVTLGDLAFNGDYLLLQADTLTLSGTVTTSQADTLVQLAPLATSTTISVLDSGTGAGTVDYSNAGHLSRFAGDTIALGTTAHTGNITLAENNAGIDIGATNLFVLTSGTVTGLDRVISSGVVKDLATLIGGGGFDVPQTDEIDTSQDVVQTLNEEYALDDGGSGDDEEDEGDEEGEDTDTDATVEEEGDSLIRQDTVDEEMMCS